MFGLDISICQYRWEIQVEMSHTHTHKSSKGTKIFWFSNNFVMCANIVDWKERMAKKPSYKMVSFLQTKRLIPIFSRKAKLKDYLVQDHNSVPDLKFHTDITVFNIHCYNFINSADSTKGLYLSNSNYCRQVYLWDIAVLVPE